MGSAKVVVGVAAMLVGATGMGIVAGGALVAGGLFAWTSLRTTEMTSIPEPVEAVALVDTQPEEITPIIAAAPVKAAEPVKAPASKPAPARASSITMTRTPSTTPAPSMTRTTSGTSTASTTATRAPATRTGSQAAEPAGDLLADEDEWEALGFDDAPDTAPSTPEPSETLDADEDLRALLED